MGNATFFTAARMQQIEDSTVVAGLVDVNGHLLLKRRDDQTIDAGNVVGPQGPRGYNNLFDFWQLTNPTSTPPSGSISANTAALVNAATLYFHVMPEGGSSFEGLFRLLKAGSMISIQSAGTPANWAQFTTTSGFSFTGNVASVNVTLKDQAGASVSSERVSVMFTQPTSTGQMGKGTSAQRDGFYGIPTTDAQRVALANSVPVWFNTEMGWEESYYAVSTLSGLTVRGLLSNVASGWYPINRGPSAFLLTTGSVAQSNWNYFDKWDYLLTDRHSRRSQDGLAGVKGANNAQVSVKLAGIYEITMTMWYTNGSGVGVATISTVHVNSIGPQPVGQARSMQFPVALLSGYSQHLSQNLDTCLMNVDSYFAFRTDAATWTIGGSDTRIKIEYISPPLA